MTDDTITYTIEDGVTYENIWRNNKIFKTRIIENNDTIIIQDNNIQLISNDNGTALISELGTYALLDSLSSSKYHVFMLGKTDSDSASNILITDALTNDYILYIDNINNSIYKFIYVDENVIYLYNIETKEMFNLRNTNAVNRKRQRINGESVENMIFDFLSLVQNIQNSVNDTSNNILETLTNGKLSTSDVENVNSIIDFLKEISNVKNAIGALQSLCNIEFFGNVHVSTGRAEVNSLNTSLHTTVSNLSENECSYSTSFNYQKVVSHNYKLGINIYDFNTSKLYSKSISSDGDYFFNHKCSEYNHGYFYEATLTLTVTIETDLDALYEFCKQDWPPQTPKPSGKRYDSRTWTISGGTRNFKTDCPDITGQWSTVWYTTPPNAKLLTMTLSSNGVCSQTYYYANRDTNITYECTYSYNYPTLTLYKDNGDIQTWEVCDYHDNSMTLKASDGFCYYLKK